MSTKRASLSRKIREARFLATKYEFSTIRKIAIRAVEMAKKAGFRYTMMDAMMDTEACHCNGSPLNLRRLLKFDDFNFAHDVFGIRRHMDRTTGELMDCFVPRSHRKGK